MADLVILNLENGDTIRCTDLADAKAKAAPLLARIIHQRWSEGLAGVV